MKFLRYCGVLVTIGVGETSVNAVFFKNSTMTGRTQWLTPIIPAFLEAEADGSPELRSSRPAWPTW